jgi:large subunit ribosomal protein L23
MNQERLLKVILGTHVSEKAMRLAEKHKQYVFEVISDATKPEVKKAVESLFNVVVSNVAVCRIKGKQKLFKQRPGRRSDLKKAYVTLAEGHSIEFAGSEIG